MADEPEARPSSPTPPRAEVALEVRTGATLVIASAVRVAGPVEPGGMLQVALPQALGFPGPIPPGAYDIVVQVSLIPQTTRSPRIIQPGIGRHTVKVN